MIHPTRTNLLLLKEKSASVSNSIAILKSRRQALIIEFLKTSTPYLESRRQIRDLYGQGITNLCFSLGIEGNDIIDSISKATARDFNIQITGKKLWGLEFKEIAPRVTRAGILRDHANVAEIGIVGAIQSMKALTWYMP